MTNVSFAGLLSDAVHHSIYMAGFCGITSTASPKAAAVSSCAAFLCGRAVLNGLIRGGNDPSDMIVFLAVYILAGTTVGCSFDKDFNFLRVASCYTITALIVSLFAKTLGAEDFYFGARPRK